jgi:hypothetical protein
VVRPTLLPTGLPLSLDGRRVVRRGRFAHRSGRGSADGVSHLRSRCEGAR